MRTEVRAAGSSMACKRSDRQRGSSACSGDLVAEQQCSTKHDCIGNRTPWLIVQQVRTGRSPWTEHATRGDSLAGGGLGSSWLHPTNPQRTKRVSGDGADHGSADAVDPASTNAVDQGKVHSATRLEAGQPPWAQLLC